MSCGVKLKTALLNIIMGIANLIAGPLTSPLRLWPKMLYLGPLSELNAESELNADFVQKRPSNGFIVRGETDVR